MREGQGGRADWSAGLIRPAAAVAVPRQQGASLRLPAAAHRRSSNESALAAASAATHSRRLVLGAVTRRRGCDGRCEPDALAL